MRLTIPTRLVLAHLAAAGWEVYGLEVARATGLESGTVAPILVRLEAHGLATGRWEDVDPAVAGRPRRRYWRLTDAGRDLTNGVAERLQRVRSVG